jgi:quercetin dioxygenase-like cupin family protein
MVRTQAVTADEDAGGPRVTIVVAGAQTGGRLAIVELCVGAGHEPPLHLHTHEDEIVYVREGRLTFVIGDDSRRVGPGTCLMLPRSIEHGYAVESEEAVLLIVLSPAGLEDRYAEVMTGPGTTGLERLITAAAESGIAITGPVPLVHGLDVESGIGR